MCQLELRRYVNPRQRRGLSWMSLDEGINYRMHPANVTALTSAGVQFCALANNHTLDWGEQGLRDTLEALDAAVGVVRDAGGDAGGGAGGGEAGGGPASNRKEPLCVARAKSESLVVVFIRCAHTYVSFIILTCGENVSTKDTLGSPTLLLWLSTCGGFLTRELEPRRLRRGCRR